MSQAFTESELEAYLDEALSPEDMAAVEEALRSQEELARRLAGINARRDAGVHTLGEIWRRHHVSCLTREQLGSYLLDALPDEQASYIRFHIEKIGCRLCRANLDDFRGIHGESIYVCSRCRGLPHKIVSVLKSNGSRISRIRTEGN